MTLTKNEINRILETLPIGYYAKTGIKVECVEGSDCYFDDSNEKIVIGCALINKGIENVSNDFNPEIAVRTILYHEVSHLILTPFSVAKSPLWCIRKLNECLYKCNITLNNNDVWGIINTVEDERIESALRNYYMNVDFRWFIMQMYDGKAPTTPFEMLYHAVRFRKGSAEILAEVHRIIAFYKDMARNSEVNVSYFDDMAHLYAMCEKEFNQQNEDKDSDDNNRSDNNQNEQEQSEESTSSQNQSQSESTQSESTESESEQSNNAQSEGDEKQNDTVAEDGGSNEENDTESDEESVGKAEGKNNDESGETLNKNVVDAIFTATFNGKIDNAIINEFRLIFKQFKSRGNFGGHTNAYSGVINPRNASRNDYRYFTRTNTENNGGSGKLHLNLWIDCSGSYCYNVDATNQIIKALEVIERENKTFTFDVADINWGVNIHNKNERYINACGGNMLCPEMDIKFKAMQKSDARNYNIVMYDGKAYKGDGSDAVYFKAWNHDNVCIISDSANAYFIGFYCGKARRIICDMDYPQMLKEKIGNILKAGFGC